MMAALGFVLRFVGVLLLVTLWFLFRVLLTLGLFLLGWSFRRRPVLGPVVLLLVGAGMHRVWSHRTPGRRRLGTAANPRTHGGSWWHADGESGRAVWVPEPAGRGAAA